MLPKFTLLRSGRKVPISHRQPFDIATVDQGCLYRRNPNDTTSYSIFVNPEYTFYHQMETLHHELFHLAEEELLLCGEIDELAPEWYVEQMSKRLFELERDAGLYRDVCRRQSEDQLELPFE